MAQRRRQGLVVRVTVEEPRHQQHLGEGLGDEQAQLGADASGQSRQASVGMAEEAGVADPEQPARRTCLGGAAPTGLGGIGGCPDRCLTIGGEHHSDLRTGVGEQRQSA